ncbi:MAG: 2Fe-2S iron-sulfur cluster binding domain-containing protein [Sinobacteraceae bacterium]|nr:2Fe-2S iron-sulfur cluster binding domain-containing protein [Nevskiaceae bacterium]
MTRVVIVTRDGAEHAVEADENRTLMETIRDRGFAELRALCGGCCSCATCHVYVDPAFAQSLPTMSEDEDAQCQCAVRSPRSSVSCWSNRLADRPRLPITLYAT